MPAASKTWQDLQRRFQVDAGARRWGLARNSFLNAARAHHKEKDFRLAIDCYLMCCVFDANGAENYSGNSETWSATQGRMVPFQDFNLEKPGAGLAPGILRRIGVCVRRGKMSKEDVLKSFDDRVSPVFSNNLPLGVSEIRDRLDSEIDEYL